MVLSHSVNTVIPLDSGFQCQTNENTNNKKHLVEEQKFSPKRPKQKESIGFSINKANIL